MRVHQERDVDDTPQPPGDAAAQACAPQIGDRPQMWVEVDTKKFAGTFKEVPDRGDLPADINENLIIELYSK